MVFVNVIELGIVIFAGLTLDWWLATASVFRLRDHFGAWGQATIAYLVSTFVYYWWHRFRHESRWFWRVCHQLHHSPRRLEVVTSFYKHPVEILCNSLISATLVYALLGCTVHGDLVAANYAGGSCMGGDTCNHESPGRGGRTSVPARLAERSVAFT